MYEANFVALMSKIVDSNPITFDEASHSMQWVEVLHEVHGNIMKNDVCVLVQLLPERKKVI